MVRTICLDKFILTSILVSPMECSMQTPKPPTMSFDSHTPWLLFNNHHYHSILCSPYLPSSEKTYFFPTKGCIHILLPRNKISIHLKPVLQSTSILTSSILLLFSFFLLLYFQKTWQREIYFSFFITLKRRKYSQKKWRQSPPKTIHHFKTFF